MKKGVIAAISSLMGTVIGMGAVGKMTVNEIRKQKGYADKHLALYLLMNQWVKVKQENKLIGEYLAQKGYKEIAIYGMNYVGETLLREVADSDVKVKYGIDKKAETIWSDIDLFSPDDELQAVDAIIVTPITFFDEIEDLLSVKMECPIISIEDILYEI